ncbi:MAG: MBOAT family protein, partial [Leptospiraceae bacterium]|nr:MBOAT family protein [Leptospiraceae bacterium]
GLIFGISEWREPHLRLAHRMEGTEIFLPLAISFYTFQIMAYGIDIYRGTYATRHRFREVVLFKAFFPQLIAGPIMRSHELLPQIKALGEGHGPTATRDWMHKGLWLVIIGLFKKVVLTAVLLSYVAPLFGSRETNPAEFHPTAVWLGVFGCLLMLYTDFSAYTDLARGFGFLLGFEIPVNFKAPFFMVSISDYWRRWHLTFSRWIRDYVYIPLGGSRVAEWHVYMNYIITFFLAGLWHGASYPYVVWGTMVGIILALENFSFKRWLPEWPQHWPLRIVRLLITWFLFLTSSLFFFAPTLDWALSALGQMFHFAALSGNDSLRQLGSIEGLVGGGLGVLLFHMLDEKPGWFVWLRRYEKWLLPLAAVVLVIVISQFAGQ